LLELRPTEALLCLQADFRVAVTGSVVELDKAVTIVKKLKLQGTPYKIYKNTAFIQVCSYTWPKPDLPCVGFGAVRIGPTPFPDRR